jgi:hypothetical protein
LGIREQPLRSLIIFLRTFSLYQDGDNSNGLLKRLLNVESLEPAVDCSAAGVVPLAKFGLRDAVFVRNCHQYPLRWLLSLDVVECVLKFFDGNLVEMAHYQQQQLMGEKL